MIPLARVRSLENRLEESTKRWSVGSVTVDAEGTTVIDYLVLPEEEQRPGTAARARACSRRVSTCRCRGELMRLIVIAAFAIGTPTSLAVAQSRRLNRPATPAKTPKNAEARVGGQHDGLEILSSETPIAATLTTNVGRIRRRQERGDVALASGDTGVQRSRHRARNDSSQAENARNLAFEELSISAGADELHERGGEAHAVCGTRPAEARQSLSRRRHVRAVRAPGVPALPDLSFTNARKPRGSSS